MEAFWQFVAILVKPDNIPIVFMMVLVLFFTWLGFKQALRNDRLGEEGREGEILKGTEREGRAVAGLSVQIASATVRTCRSRSSPRTVPGVPRARSGARRG